MGNYSFFHKFSRKKGSDDTEFKLDLAKTAMPIPVPEESAEDDGPVGQLTVDIYHTPNDIVVESAIAGAQPEDIDVSVSPDSLSIKGIRRRELGADAEYLHQECYWGKFTRSIILPEEVEPQNADVSFKNGILSITLPKTNRNKTRKLHVRMD
jgi:HSP20 family protein